MKEPYDFDVPQLVFYVDRGNIVTISKSQGTRPPFFQ